MTLTANLDSLIDRWCERKALKPLKYLLPVYPGPLAHTDQAGDLLQALRDIKGLCRSDLNRDELGRLVEAINDLEDRLKSK